MTTRPTGDVEFAFTPAEVGVVRSLVRRERKRLARSEQRLVAKFGDEAVIDAGYRDTVEAIHDKVKDLDV